MSDIQVLLLPKPASLTSIRASLSDYVLSKDEELGEVEELNVLDSEGDFICIIECYCGSPSGDLRKELLRSGADPEQLQAFIFRYGKWPKINRTFVRLSIFRELGSTRLQRSSYQGRIIAHASAATRIGIQTQFILFDRWLVLFQSIDSH